MSNIKLAGAVTAACAACCAVSVVPALLAGTSLVAISAAVPFWGIGMVALTIPIAGLYLLSRRKAAASGDFQTLMASAEKCGCGSSCSSTKAERTEDEPPVVCTLDAGDYKERTATIRALAQRSLKHAARKSLSLTLTYEPEALEEVRDLVAKEQRCCSFLTFDLSSDAHAVVLTITAPKTAAEAADVLFDQFAPDLAHSNKVETV
jgi:hypothetical protein